MNFIDSICKALEDQRDTALVSVVEQSASSPRHAGASMLVGPEGLLAGTIGGGAMEHEAIEAGRRVIQSRIAEFMDFDLTNRDAAVADMICGGRMRLFVEPLVADKPTTVLFQRLRIAYAMGDAMFAVVPVKASGQRRLCKLASPEWPLPIELRDIVRAELAKDGLASPRVVKNSEGLEFVLAPWRCPSRLILVGGGHVALATARVADFAGFTVSVVDDREEFASRERFPEAAVVRVCEDYRDCFKGFAIDKDTFIAIMTRGHLHDREALQQALGTRAGYIGMIGSKRKTATVYAKLKEEGASDADLARVTAPIGLPIGAETPEEIAVSIVAQLIEARARMSGSTRHLAQSKLCFA